MVSGTSGIYVAKTSTSSATEWYQIQCFGTPIPPRKQRGDPLLDRNLVTVYAYHLHAILRRGYDYVSHSGIPNDKVPAVMMNDDVILSIYIVVSCSDIRNFT